MKVLHVTTSSKGGAGIAARRLHEALCKHGVKSAFVSTNLTIDYNNQITNDPFFAYRKPNFKEKVLRKIKKKFTVFRRERLKKELELLTDEIQCEIATLPFSFFQLQDHPLYLEADIINLHWINGVIDFPVFFSKNKKPIIWTFHDMNPFMGLFHYQGDEVKNRVKAAVLDSKIKKIKNEAIKKIKHGIVISPSKWLLEEIKSNQVFSVFDKFCVPNSIDLDVFKIIDKNELRDRYGIPREDFVLLFVSESLTNVRKGYDLLLKSLSILREEKITLLTIGKGELPTMENHKVISMGEISSNSKMVECYALANAFILPSREDNLPNVILESFACGLPIVGFDVGGVSEHVIENYTGILGNELSASSLAEAIISMKDNHVKYDSQIIREYAENSFSFKKQAQSYSDIYSLILRQSNKV